MKMIMNNLYFSLMRMAKLDVSLRLIVMSREPADLVGFVPFHHHTHMPSSTLRLACTLAIRPGHTDLGKKY